MADIKNETQKITASVEISEHGNYMREYRKTEKGKAALRRAFEKYQERNRCKVEAYRLIRDESRKWAQNHIPGGIPKGYVLHHAFGESTRNFIMLPNDLHKALHSKFGRSNIKCSWNPDTEAFLKDSGKPFYVFFNGKLTVSHRDLF